MDESPRQRESGREDGPLTAAPIAQTAADDPAQPSSGASADLDRLAATVTRLRGELRDAHVAADGRALIELAKGILVERLHCGPVHAAQQLATLSDMAGLSQFDLAADIVNQAARDPLAEIAAEFRAHADALRAAETHRSPTTFLRTAESCALAATDTQAVAESLLEHALAPFGATAVAIWAAGADTSLTLVGAAGFTAQEVRRWCYLPPGVATPAHQAITERHTVWVPALSASTLPSIGQQETNGGARAAVPAIAGGRVLGVLEICWPHLLEPQPPPIERQFNALAELCAHTLRTHDTAAEATRPGVPREVLELVGLAENLSGPALVLRPHLDADGRLTDFRIHHTNARFADPSGRPRSAVTGALLLECYPMAAGENGMFERIEHVHATGEPFHAERMPLAGLAHPASLTTVTDISITRHGGSVLLTWHVQDEAARLASLLQHTERLGRIGGFEEITDTGEVVWSSQVFSFFGLPPTAAPISLSQLPRHADADDSAAIGRFLRTLLHHRLPASTVFRLHPQDGPTRHIRVVAEPVLGPDGRLLTVHGAYQDISAQHWTELALAATRDRLAHSEQQSAERNRLALQLQHAIMPPTRDPIDAADLRIAVHYRPAEQEHLVGGDWYDAVILPSKQILVSVGDVAGHGIEAATSMVVLRNALRGLAATGAGPAQLLTWLNLVVHHLTEHVTATAICGLYDPETRVLRWARAGHLPPVLVRRHQATTLPLIGGLLLGALAEAAYEEGEVHLEPEDSLLLYTDGLIERRDSSLEDSLRQLLAIAERRATTLEQRLDNLLTHSNADTDDDTCIVGIHLS